VPLTQTQLASAVADRAEISRNETKRVLAALEEVVLEELGNAQKVRVGGLVQLTVRVKPAQKARKGRNPATGEEITIAAKPASVDLRARPLARAKAALPSVQKARRRRLTPRLGAAGPRSQPPSGSWHGLPFSRREPSGQRRLAGFSDHAIPGATRSLR